jgi:YbbR domain-containing protein
VVELQVKTEYLQMIIRNWPFKLLALALALGFWLFVVGQERAEVTLRVPLALVDRPADMIIVSQSAKSVEVRLSGTRGLIERIGARRLTLNLKLTRKKQGRHDFYLKPSHFPLPRGVSVVQISPSLVTIRLDKRVQKRLRLPLILKNQPPNSYLVGAPPKGIQVWISGPSAVLSGLRAPLNPPVLDLARAGEGPNRFRLSLAMFRFPAQVSVTRVRPETVTIRLEAMVRRRLQVRLSTEARLECIKGFRVSRVDFMPRTVLARGPRSVLRDRRQVFTRPVTENKLWQNRVFVVPLEMIDSRVTVEPRLVEMRLSIAPNVPGLLDRAGPWPFTIDLERFLPELPGLEPAPF